MGDVTTSTTAGSSQKKPSSGYRHKLFCSSATTLPLQPPQHRNYIHSHQQIFYVHSNTYKMYNTFINIVHVKCSKKTTKTIIH